MISKGTVLTLLAIVAVGHSIPTFFEPEKEYIYSYNAKINVGTYKPAIFASQFMLNGKLHIQNTDNSLFMRLSDLHYKLYNGELNQHDEYEATALPMPKEAEDLLKPIQMKHEKGKIQHFTSDLHDRKFSTDMKKAIASLMQMDLVQMKFDAKTPYAFTTNEDSIYGKLRTRYNVLPDESEIIVQKMLDIQSAEHWMAYFGITESEIQENLAEQSPITVDSHREYLLQKEDHGFLVKTIESQGGIFNHMMKGFTDTQFMYVNQTMHLTEKIPISEKMSLGEEKTTVDDLSFEMEADESHETLTDLASGRSDFTMEKAEKLIDGILDEVVTHTKMEKLKMESPDLKQGQGINRLHRIMGMLDLSGFEKMYLHLSEQSNLEKFKIFQEMIPLIGTRASIKFIRNLIRKQKVEDDIAISMLQRMPFQLRMPSRKLLTEVEDLITLENVSPDVHKAAVLSFATLVYKTHTHYMMDRDLVKQTMKDDLLEKYILKYMELLKSSQDYKSQFMYMQGLYNIRIGNVMKYLEPYVRGEATTNQHLRYLAMCSSFNEAIIDPEYAYKMYWPIFADTTLNTELRIAADLILMSTKPYNEKVYDMYWILKDDPDTALYNFHKSLLKSVVNTNTYMHTDEPAQILNFMRKPYRKEKTGFYLADYEDPKYGFGGSNKMMMHTTNTSKQIFIDLGGHMYNFQPMSYGLWLKIDGLDRAEMLNASIFDWKEHLNTLLTKCNEQNSMRIEYAWLQNDKVTDLNVLECKDYKKFFTNIKQHLPKSSFSISYELVTQNVMPNDLGMPAVFELLIPNMMNNKLMTDAANQQTHWKFERSSHAKMGIMFYNPVLDIWQGAERILTNEIITDMTFKYTVIEPDTMKLTIMNQNDDTRDKFALRNYATIMTYVYKDVDNVLQKSSKNSEHFAKVSRGSQYRKHKTLMEHDCPHTGLHFKIDIFDTKRHVSHKTLMENLKTLMQTYFKNHKNMPFGYMLLVLQNMAHRMILSPEPGTFGLLIRATPSKKYQVDQAELLFQMSHERMTEELTLKLLRKFNINTSLTTHDKDMKLLNQWALHSKFVMDMDRTIENYNMHLTKMMMPDEKKMYQICMNGKREMQNNKIMRHKNITMGYTTNEEMCNDEGVSMWMTMMAEPSDEQLDMMKNKMEYEECLPMHMHEPLLKGMNIDYTKGFDCMRMKTSLRKQEMDIKMSITMDKFLAQSDFSMLKGLLYPYYSWEKMNKVMDPQTMKLIVEYPTIGDEVTIEMMEENVKHKFTEMPLQLWSLLGFHPENYYYSNMFMKLMRMKMVDSCLIADRHIYNNHEELMKLMDDEWMRVVFTEPNYTNQNMVIFVKQMGKQMALKVLMDDTILEIMPDGNNYKISMNGKPLTLTKDSYLEEKLFNIGMLNDEDNTIIMNMFNYPFYMNYDGENIEMHKLMTDTSLTGACFIH